MFRKYIPFGALEIRYLFWGERMEFNIDVGKENCLCRSDNLSLDSV